MSSTGQVVGGIVGAVVGFFAGGNVVYGAQIGMMIGGLLDPPKTKGPRLDDLTAQTSVYGAFIPRLYGTVPVFGNVIWIQGDRLVEHEAEDDGKGGPVVTNFEYFATFAVGLCEGPIDGVRRIWVGGQLWYDAGSDNLATIIASNQNAGKFTLYTGTDTQTADPLIQADRGVANVPAYRGLAYIVFDELPLKDYSNTLAAAQVKVEVVSQGVFNNSIVRDLAIPAATDWHGTIRAAGNQHDMYGFANFVAVDNAGYPVWVRYTGEDTHTSRLDDEYDPLLVGGTMLFPRVFGATAITTSLVDAHYAFEVDTNYVVWGSNGQLNAFYVSGLPDFKAIAEGNGSVYILWVSGLNYWLAKIGNDAVSGRLKTYSTRIDIYPDAPVIAVWSGGLVCAERGIVSTDPIVVKKYDDMLGLLSTFSVAVPVDAYQITTVESSAYVYDDKLYLIGDVSASLPNAVVVVIDLATESLIGTYAVPQSFDTVTVPKYPNLTVIDGIVYYGQRNNDLSFAFSHHAWVIDTISSNTIALSEIVKAECLKSDLLTAGDLDVTELTDPVRGYRVSSLSPLRGGIDPLRKAWPFDAIQRGYKIKFKKRGGASVATITEGELDARAAGVEPGVRVSNSREMDLVLPDQLTAQYLDAAREYDVNVAEESR